MPSETLTCALGIGADTLSAWRDELLPREERDRLRVHVAECAVCGRRLAELDEVARVLRAQRELEPGNRIVDGVRQRGGQPHGRDWMRWMPHGRRDIWSGLGALGAVAAVLLLFVYVLAGGPRGQLTGKATPTATVSPTATKPATPTAQPTPTHAPAFSPLADVGVAWGTHGATATVTTQIDDTHTFEAYAITPDGATLIGYERSRGSGAQLWDITAVGLFVVATRRFTAMNIPVDPNVPPGCCLTDGRFVIVQTSDQPGAAGAIFHVRFWAYDRTTGQTWVIATGSQYHGILNAYLSHGLFVFGTNDGTIQVADLATRTITPLPMPPLGALVAFNWPYVVYLQNDSAVSPSPVVVHDLTTKRDVTLAALARLPQSTDTTGMALADDTLFFTVTPENGPATTLYQLDHLLSPDAQAQPIATLPTSAFSGLVSADDRLVLFVGAAAWDRVEQRMVTFGGNTGGGGGFRMMASGGYFALQQPPDAPGIPYAELVTIFDISQLPVRP